MYRSFTRSLTLLSIISSTLVVARHPSHPTVTITETTRITTTVGPTCDCTCEPQSIITQTVTSPGYCNATSLPGTGSPTTTSTSTTSTASCLPSLPPLFKIQESNIGYLIVNTLANYTSGTRDLGAATAFQLQDFNETFSFGGVDNTNQLAFESGSGVVYGAVVDEEGGPLRWVANGQDSATSGAYAIVTATWSTYLCQLELMAFFDHDVSEPQDCNGTFALSSQQPGCRAATLTVLPSIHGNGS